MRKKRLLGDLLKFLKAYQNAITLSDNETADIEHYLRAKGLMDLARFYGKSGFLPKRMMDQIESVFREIEHMTVLRIRDDLNS